jgi:protein required for attachment to host cells
MTDKLIVVADLGRVKAFRVSRDDMSPNSRLELVDDVELMDAHGRLLDKVTDKAGRFPGNGTGPGGMSIGEKHGIQEETERRLLRQVVERINTLAKNEHIWYLAAVKEINPRVVEKLDPDVRSKMAKNISADLIKIPKDQILSHF